MGRMERKILIAVMIFLTSAGLHLVASVPEALAVEPICPGGSAPDPNVIFCEDWEAGNFNQWPEQGSAGVTPLITTTPENVFFGTNSAEFVFNISGSGDPRSGGFIKAFLQPSPAAPEVYFRWYQKWSANFPMTRPGGSFTRMFRVNRTDDLFMSLRASDELANADPVFLIFDPPSGVVYGSGRPPIVADRWYLFEVYIKYNSSPGSDGAVKLWVDEVLAIERNNIPTTGPAGDMVLWLAGYLSGSGDPYQGSTELRFSWVDQLVVSRTPIGPINVGGGKNAPQAPTGLKVVD